MRKIKRPNIAVKTREVFYRLKRGKQLDDLTEESIEEILNSKDLKSLLDPGCVYASFERTELDSSLPIPSVGSTISLGVASLGDLGFETYLKTLNGPSQKVVMTWAQVMLDKLVDFSHGLIKEEAAQENLEPGPAAAVDLDKEAVLARWIWERLSPMEKIRAGLVQDPLDGALKTSPVFTRAWTIAWLSKKEKKKLAAV